jgi:hypothetical protein
LIKQVYDVDPHGGPFGYDELGYDEFDIVDDYFEHKLLFSTGIEIKIIFKNFEYRFIL